MTVIAAQTVADFTVLRNVTAQATTGQTDWVFIPQGYRYAYIDYNLTSVGASTTPTSLLSIQVPDLSTMDDTTGVVNLMNYTAFTTMTAAARLFVQIGPGVTGIADDVTTSATGNSNASINAVLPPVLGIKVLNDRGSGDEVYTYSLTLTLRK